MMSLELLILAILIAFFFQAWARTMRRKKGNRLPPGPRGLPIFGSLHLLGKFPHRDLQKLSQKYGSIMHLRLGMVSTVVVSSPQAAEQFLKTHDLVFSSRPPMIAAKYISYGQKNLAFAQYGSYWRTVRKMCTLELLSSLKISSFKPVRKQEVDLLIDHIRGASRRRVAIDLSTKVSSLIADMSCRMIFGKKYSDKELDERGFKAVIQEIMKLAATPNLAEYIPQLEAFDINGLNRQMKAVAKVLDGFFEKIVDEHMQFKDQDRTKDFVDVMLGFVGSEETEYHIGRDNIKAIMLDLLSGFMDTSSTTIDWALAEIMKQPLVLKKIQEELEEKVGLDKMVEESDLESLEYLNMVIKETFRLHPPVPMLIPHESTDDSYIDGCLIPKKSRILVNVWAIGRDSSAWTDAERFFPERFVGSNINTNGHDFQLLPFGSGRRGCPGMQLGLLVVRLVLAQLLHCFEWELPDGISPEDLDMTEEFSLVMPRAKHLLAIPNYRLRI